LHRTQLKLESVVEEATTKCGVDKSKLLILLAGGASKMPAIAKMVEQTTGIKPITHKNPEHLVTIGAALWAHLRDGKGTILVQDPQKPLNADGSVNKKAVQITDKNIDIAGYAVGLRSIGWSAEFLSR